MDEAVRLASTAEPGQEALRKRSLALEEEAVAAAQIDDPRLVVGLMNLPIESLDFEKEAMTQFAVGIQQKLPRGSSRKATGAMLRANAAATAAEAANRSRHVALAVRNAWLNLFFWQRTAETIQQDHELFTQLVDITLSLYSVGSKNQQDVLTAEVELDRLDDRLTDTKEKTATHRASLARWVGVSAARRPLTGSLPAWPTLGNIDQLQGSLLQHPILDAANQRVLAAEHAVTFANELYKPAWTFDLKYGYRGGTNAFDQLPREDFISAVVSADLPFFTGKRQDRTMNAAVGRHGAALDSVEERRRLLDQQLQEWLARWETLGERIEIYESRILPQSQLRSEAALAAYQSEAGDFADVINAYIDALNFNLEFIRLRTERDKARANLSYLTGEPS